MEYSANLLNFDIMPFCNSCRQNYPLINFVKDRNDDNIYLYKTCYECRYKRRQSYFKK
jgi:hypothetical protein